MIDESNGTTGGASEYELQLDEMRRGLNAEFDKTPGYSRGGSEGDVMDFNELGEAELLFWENWKDRSLTEDDARGYASITGLATPTQRIFSAWLNNQAFGLSSLRKIEKE